MTREEIIKALRQFINQVDWVSVNKKLPCDELRCRVVLNGDFSCDYPATYRAYDPGPGFGRFNWDDYEYHFYSNVTHWKEQPLYNAKDLCRAAADLLEQDANTKSRLLPIPIKEITGTSLVTPCWIEIKYGEGYTYIAPDILDKDSTGYFGKLYSRVGDTTQYLYEQDYNRTWRCWRECPGDETVNNAKWEESQ